MRRANNKRGYIERCLTGRVSISFEVLIENFESLRCERRSTFAFLGRFAADEIGQVLHAVLVSFLGLGHPSLQHRLDLLCTLRRYIQLLEPATTIIMFNSNNSNSADNF